MSFFNCCTVEDLNSGKIGAQGDSNVKGQAMEIERHVSMPVEFQDLSQKQKVALLPNHIPQWSLASVLSDQKFAHLKSKLVETIGKDEELSVFGKISLFSLKLKSGGAYFGQCLVKDAKNNVYERHGVGHYFDGDNTYYVGCWENNSPHGTGLMIESCGDYFLGQFSAGNRLLGVHYSLRDRRTYTGTFDEHEVPFGRGKIEYDDGRIYQGTVSRGFPNGFGYFCWPNGNYYEGGFAEGLKHGSGDLFLASTNENSADASESLQRGKNGKLGQLFKNTEWENGVPLH